MTELDLLAESKRITSDLLTALVDEADVDWKEVKKSDGITIYARKSKYMEDKVYKSECTIDVCPAHLLALVNPLKPYRCQWDPFLEQLVVHKQVANNIYVIQHLTRPAFKGAVSARDSVDLVSIGQKDDYFYVSAGAPSQPLSDYPSTTDRVRTTQYPAGYVLRPVNDDANKTKFLMCFHTDLNMNQLVSMMATMVKPTLMIDKLKALRKAVTTLEVTPTDLEHGLP